MSIWFWFWAVLAAILIVLEIFTAGFFMLPFGIGAAASAVVAVLAEDQVGLQWIVFIVLSGVTLLALRRFADRITHDPPTRVGADRVLGKSGVVVEELEPGSPRGRIRVEAEEWRAETPDGTPLPVGARVCIERIEGTRLIVTATEGSSDEPTA
jgi:membrane protein implicated in regulation of membrane protease activity